jgi:hypothetical protein
MFRARLRLGRRRNRHAHRRDKHCQDLIPAHAAIISECGAPSHERRVKKA